MYISPELAFITFSNCVPKSITHHQTIGLKNKKY